MRFTSDEVGQWKTSTNQTRAGTEAVTEVGKITMSLMCSKVVMATEACSHSMLDLIQRETNDVLLPSGNTGCWVAVDGQDHRGRGHSANGTNTLRS